MAGSLQRRAVAPATRALEGTTVYVSEVVDFRAGAYAEHSHYYELRAAVH